MRGNHPLEYSSRNERFKLLPNESCKIIKTILNKRGDWQEISELEEVSSTSIDSSKFLIIETVQQSIEKGEEGQNPILPIQKLGMNIDCWNDSGDPGKLFFKMEGGFPSSNLSVKYREDIYPLISTIDPEICYAEVGQLNEAEIFFELIAPKITWPLANVKKDNVSSRILIIDGNISHHTIRFETSMIDNFKERLNAMKITIFVEMIDWERNTTLIKFDAPLTRNLDFNDLISLYRDKVVAYRLKNIKITDTISTDLLKKLNLINKRSNKLKILGQGEIKSKINIIADLASKSALEKMEKIGGSIQIKK